MYNRIMILGIDEAGRGPWAGPLVVGAVVLPDDVGIEGLTDSKKLTKKRREALEPRIKQTALAYGLGWVHAEELDEVGMSEALRRATVRAVEHINTPYHDIIIDGTVNFLAHTAKGNYVTTFPKADALIPAVSAASILAKVARDQWMSAQDDQYPGYGFARHAGYGTAAHQAAIAAHGVSPLHRLSFAPLRQYQTPPEPPLSLGNIAETEAARYLEAQGHTILARNWRTRFCEIDILSQKQDVVYIVEVKHRTTAKGGDGIAAITPRKAAKLRLGAHVYQSQHSLHDVPLRLAVVATKGTTPQVEHYLEFE
jgi:ribonuclease HII